MSLTVRWRRSVPGTTIRTVTLIEKGHEKAFAVVHKRDGTVYIADMEVATDSRRRGYGSKLMRSIERKVCDKPRILQLLSKPEAVDFWASQGFVGEGPSARFCKGKRCATWQRMSKPCKRHRRYL